MKMMKKKDKEIVMKRTLMIEEEITKMKEKEGFRKWWLKKSNLCHLRRLMRNSRVLRINIC